MIRIVESKRLARTRKQKRMQNFAASSNLLDMSTLTTVKSRDSSVGIALGYGLDDRGSRVQSRRGLGIFHFTTASRTVLRPTQPPIQWILGAISLGVKRPVREADHSPPKSKNEWRYTSTPQYAFMAWYLAKHRDNFTFTLP
jgi:hypothetical protein